MSHSDGNISDMMINMAYKDIFGLSLIIWEVEAGFRGSSKGMVQEVLTEEVGCPFLEEEYFPFLEEEEQFPFLEEEAAFLWEEGFRWDIHS